MGANKRCKEDVEDALAEFLAVYRNTPHSSTGKPPSEALLGRRFKDRLDFLCPGKNSTPTKLRKTKSPESSNRKERTFNERQMVYVRDYTNPNKAGWIPAEVTQILGKRHYLCILPSGREKKFNVDQMIERYERAATGKSPESNKKREQRHEVKFEKPKRKRMIVSGWKPSSLPVGRGEISEGKETSESESEGTLNETVLEQSIPNVPDDSDLDDDDNSASTANQERTLIDDDSALLTPPLMPALGNFSTPVSEGQEEPSVASMEASGVAELEGSHPRNDEAVTPVNRGHEQTVSLNGSELTLHDQNISLPLAKRRDRRIHHEPDRFRPY